MASTRSLPDLSLEALKREEDAFGAADASSSPTGLPSPDWSRASSPDSFTASGSLSPEPELLTPNPSQFFPALASPRPVPSPPRYHDDEEREGGFEDARSSTDDQGGEGGPGTFTLHHHTRARSDYSIHSAPELDTAHMEESFLSDELARSPSPASPNSSTPKHYEALQRLPYTLWDYLQEEVRRPTPSTGGTPAHSLLSVRRCWPSRWMERRVSRVSG